MSRFEKAEPDGIGVRARCNKCGDYITAKTSKGLKIFKALHRKSDCKRRVFELDEYKPASVGTLHNME